MQRFGSWSGKRRSCGLVKEYIQERFLLWSYDAHFTAPVSLLARLRLPAGLLAASSSSHTERQLRRKMYNLAAFLPRRRLGTRPIPLPCPRTGSPGGLQAVPARCFLVESRRAAHTRGSPLPLVLCKATVLRSCTTLRASLPLSDDSLGILCLEASPGSPWPFAHIMLPFYTIGHAGRVLPSCRRLPIGYWLYYQ